ncbi:hypothetical protein SNE40_021550 [Patella caerulea]|uniref:Cadherin domain-containing protein n=1 Tax=Patella caerulea TaxID=87958 RepID=A0AAN8G4N1_PATCE
MFISQSLQLTVTFDPTSATIAETPTDNKIADIQTDSSGTDNLICNIASTSPRDGPFQVWTEDDGASYQLYYVESKTTSKVLNATITPEYDLTIECSDDTDTTATDAVLVVTVQGNQPPEATGVPTTTTISVSSPNYQNINSVVHSLSVTDPENDLLSYTMYSDPDLGYFTIDAYSGEIKTAVDLKTATVEEIPLYINVSDGHNTIGPLKVTIKLTDMNQRPVFSNLPANITIKEDATAEQVITILTFNDDSVPFDAEPQCSVWPNSEKYKFTYDTRSRKLELASQAVTGQDKPLDYESTNFYNITCYISDGYLYNEGDYINLSVLDVNEEPVFKETSYSCILYESEIGVSQCDLPMTVTDPDNDNVNLALLSGNNSERFSLVDNDKKLTFNINYDVDEDAMPTEAVLTVAAVDEHGLTGTSKIKVTILDKNDNTPEFQSSIRSYVITETQALGTLGTAFTATDKDSGSNGDITYTVKSGSTASSYVRMVGDGNFEYSGKYPESLGGTSQTILVEAKDNGNPRLSSTGTVIVTFQPYSTTTTTTTTTLPTVVNLSGSSGSSSGSSSSNTASSSSSDNSAFIGLLAGLLSLLLLGLIGALAYFLCCKGGSGKCFGGSETKVQTERVHKVHPDEYYRDRRYITEYERDYDARDLDYDDRRRGRDDYYRRDVYEDIREGSPYSASQVKLLKQSDLPRVV